MIRVFFVDDQKKTRDCVEVPENVSVLELKNILESSLGLNFKLNPDIYINGHVVKEYDHTLEDLNVPEGSIIKLSQTGTVQNNYPLFVRNTRIKSVINTSPIKILEPETIPKKPELNIVTTLLPTLLMFGLVVVLRGVMNKSGGTFVIFSICSMGLGLFTTAMNLVNNQRSYKKSCKNRKEKYLKYIDEKKSEIEYERKEEIECLRETYYSIDDDLRHINEFSTYLFDRIPTDSDFLDVYIGTGNILAKKNIDYKEQEKLESGDEISLIPSQIAYDYRFIEEAPVVVKFAENSAIGVVSEEKYQHELLRNIVIDLATRQYYGDLNIYVFIDELDIEKYRWLELVPHMRHKDSSVRNIICSEENKNSIFEALYSELTYRSENKGASGYNVILILKEYGIKSHPVSKFIEHAKDYNTTFVFFEDNSDKLPLYCNSIIRLIDESKGVVFDSNNKIENQKFNYKPTPDGELLAAMEKLSPIYCEEISLDGSLRKNISLYEMLGINHVSEIKLGDNWINSKIFESMAVPLGVNAKNEIVNLNLHEKYHGPHGLVAGTTGSGKSEILQSYILSASLLFSPYEIGFVIIDFKGGGMVNQFRNLPHLIGAITNIDGKQIERSLRSIKAELLKRQTLFAEQQVNHIDKYIKNYKEGKAKTALPHLVIIVDEFAELKAEQPEFMKELISTARIGRSLGVHLILATQKPAGQVNEQIWSNSKFKLCLKVQNKEDSNEVLKSPLAAEIREPGRAYLQVGNNEIFELFQSAYSGASAERSKHSQKRITVFSVDFAGRKSVIYEQKPEVHKYSKNQLEEIVEYINDYCRSENIEKLQEICLPAIEEKIPLNTEAEKNMELSIPVGIYDDPDRQSQGQAYISVGNSNTIILGSAQFGKTNILQVIIRLLAATYSPKEVNLYILDFGSMILKNFEKLAHVGGVICPSDDEKLKNFFKYMNTEIIRRREKMLSVGVSSFTAYKEAGYKDLPNIVVLIDNMTALKELYLTAGNDDLLPICRDGIAVGITFVITNGQTNGLGFKYLSNFSTRISLFCNDKGEYVALFGSGKTRPDEIPGRCVLELDKSLYECQSYLAFEGDKEIERTEKIREFIEEINSESDSRANKIPEIPEVLLEETMLKSEKYVPGEICIGIGYDNINNIVINTARNNVISLSGEEGSGKSRFVRYLLHYLAKNENHISVSIVDNFKKKLSCLINEAMEIKYTSVVDEGKAFVEQIYEELSADYDRLTSGEEVHEKWHILVISNDGFIEEISKDKAMLAKFKDIIGKYKQLKTLAIFADIANQKIASFGTPELYKIVKENKNLLYFGNLDNCNVMDVSVQASKRYTKAVKPGDAYLFTQNEILKVKIPKAK